MPKPSGGKQFAMTKKMNILLALQSAVLIIIDNSPPTSGTWSWVKLASISD
jgi:gamma-glutamylcysteine synthetase